MGWRERLATGAYNLFRRGGDDAGAALARRGAVEAGQEIGEAAAEQTLRSGDTMAGVLDDIAIGAGDDAGRIVATAGDDVAPLADDALAASTRPAAGAGDDAARLAAGSADDAVARSGILDRLGAIGAPFRWTGERLQGAWNFATNRYTLGAVATTGVVLTGGTILEQENPDWWADSTGQRILHGFNDHIWEDSWFHRGYLALDAAIDRRFTNIDLGDEAPLATHNAIDAAIEASRLTPGEGEELDTVLITRDEFLQAGSAMSIAGASENIGDALRIVYNREGDDRPDLTEAQAAAVYATFITTVSGTFPEDGISSRQDYYEFQRGFETALSDALTASSAFEEAGEAVPYIVESIASHQPGDGVNSLIEQQFEHSF